MTARRAARLDPRLAATLAILVAATLPGAAMARPAAAVRGGISAAHTMTAPGTSSAADAAVGTPEPSIQYLDAMAHENDVIDFTPGDRVQVGYAPRASDAWSVDGARPRSLSVGRVSGQQLRDAKQGSTWAGTPPPRRTVGASTEFTAPIDGAMGPSIAASSTLALGPSLAGTPAAPDAVVDPNGLRREVFGFLPYWQVSDSSTTYDWSVLSTVAYFSVGADAAGNLLKQNADGSVTTGWGGWTSTAMTAVTNAAHQHGTRVVLTISSFAWTSGQATTQATLLGSPTARANLARQAAAAVAERGADGINLDFEPIASGHADDFTAFVRQVRAELDAIAPGYQLTFDATGYIGNYPIENATAPGGADAIFIMGYDYRGSSASQAGSISPLTGPVYDLTDTVSAYAARVSPSKLILGVPYYGRAWSTDSNALHANNISGTEYGASVTALYSTAADLAASNGRLYDATEQAPWTVYQKQTCTTTYGCVTSWRELYYDDAASLKLRYDFVNQAGLRGAGIWALGYDGTRPELYQALADKFLRDTTPPNVGIRTLAPTQTDAGFEVSWFGHDDSSIASYDVQVAVDGGSWADWQTATSATSAVFLGANGHAYTFRARARDSHGNVSTWDVTSTATAPSLAVGGFGTVLIDGLNVRAAAGTSAASIGTLNTGDVVAFTAGPVAADGYTWYQVTEPVRQWTPVDAVDVGVWIAVGSGSMPYVAARRPPNATAVSALLANYTVGGVSRILSPNGDGIDDTIAVGWTATGPLDSLGMQVWRPDGTLIGTVSGLPTGGGAQAFVWDGSVGGAIVPDGTYVLQLVGTKGAATYTAPSAKPLSSDQVTTFGVSVQHLSVSRLGGADRYATAALISAATFAPGVPVAYLATGLNFPDALAGAAAAGVVGGPLLLVGTSTLPASTAAELARLKPARIVILGATGVVSDAVAAAARAYTLGTVSRLGGADRYATAALISAATFAPGVPVAYLATGLNFPDALAGAAAAGVVGGPLLLVGTSTLPASTAAELARLKPARIVILGATGVVSDAVAAAASLAAHG